MSIENSNDTNAAADNTTATRTISAAAARFACLRFIAACEEHAAKSTHAVEATTKFVIASIAGVVRSFLTTQEPKGRSAAISGLPDMASRGESMIPEGVIDTYRVFVEQVTALLRFRATRMEPEQILALGRAAGESIASLLLDTHAARVEVEWQKLLLEAMVGRDGKSVGRLMHTSAYALRAHGGLVASTKASKPAVASEKADNKAKARASGQRAFWARKAAAKKASATTATATAAAPQGAAA